MSKQKGRKYERELKGLLEDRGIHVVDIAHNSGLEGRFHVDLLAWLAGGEPEKGWQEGADQGMYEVEVKYRTQGHKRLYNAHQSVADVPLPEWVGRRGLKAGAIRWRDGFVTCGGTPFLRMCQDWSVEFTIPYANALSNKVSWVTDAYEDKEADVLAVRTARRPWIFVTDEDLWPDGAFGPRP